MEENHQERSRSGHRADVSAAALDFDTGGQGDPGNHGVQREPDRGPAPSELVPISAVVVPRWHGAIAVLSRAVPGRFSVSIPSVITDPAAMSHAAAKLKRTRSFKADSADVGVFTPVPQAPAAWRASLI